MKRKHIILFCVALFLLVGVAWLIWGNVTVGLTTYAVTEDDLPSAFDGYRIAHVSDLHNSWLWEQAIVQLKKADPDIICLTGDIVDGRFPNIELSLQFAEEAMMIAPCYYITGNHEESLPEEQFNQLMDGLTGCGVVVLSDSEILLERAGEIISLCGHDYGVTDYVGYIPSHDGYKILLSHQPEDMMNYVAAEYDLVLSGHAHGGQARLPLIGGLYAPGQGFLPEYDSGVYSEGQTDMVVSRGIGNSGFPIRFNNRPEVIVIVLHCV